MFANLVLTDEVNRAPAKVQSALLEVMAERQVSIGGETRPLPHPFLVLATQNPVESEGVYTLPEAQRDRFLMKVIVGYPSPTEELEIVRRVGISTPEASTVMSLDELQQYQQAADRVFVDNAVAQYAVDLVMATREPNLRGLPELEPLLDFGVSPRATLGLVAAARALAVLRGRSYVVPQDVFDVARDVLRHRLMLSYEALAKGLSADDVLNRILAVVPAAAVTPVQPDRSAIPPPASSLPPPPAPGAAPGPTVAAPSAQAASEVSGLLSPTDGGAAAPTSAPSSTPSSPGAGPSTDGGAMGPGGLGDTAAGPIGGSADDTLPLEPPTGDDPAGAGDGESTGR